MFIRKCPKCDNGKMKPVKMFQGWGKAYLYLCNECKHEKWIYEGSATSEYGGYENSNSSFWILLIAIEIIVFFNDDIKSIFDYILYILFFVFFLYKTFTPKYIYDENIKEAAYEIIEVTDELLTPKEQEQEELIEQTQKDGMRFWVYPIVFIGSIFAAIYFENLLFLIGSLLALGYAYYFGHLDISKHRRK